MKFSYYRLLNQKPVQCKNASGAFDAVTTFRDPVTRKGPKLYVVRLKGDILYVGITSQSITSRLRYGFAATGQHGYHGYKWKAHGVPLDILIWCFHDKKTFVEAIEAEVVFLIRQRTGRWPLAQTEIHFHNALDETKQLAAQIAETAMARE